MENKNTSATPLQQTYFHGTKADLKAGDLITVGFKSNFSEQKPAQYVFMTATLDAAIWGAELAVGDTAGKIYLVEPTGDIENDPDLTDKKYAGNPSLSYRSAHPLRVLGEVIGWQGHEASKIQAMKDALEKLKLAGVKSLNE